ncbi:programmed cell death 1 ligand 1 isoform X2 [Rhinatrema bivittatum]|uniref:programmed cell death 1 ligand 1 isoform X2 n=1 Tax=Rhinatrema bivittatum TaxID=194408 RepID=UPI00112DDDC1|nr:programmed cell death 1 ligand 1 isoform X2 [Rhinatrema bivittatum]
MALNQNKLTEPLNKNKLTEQVPMEKTLLVFTFLSNWCSINALFTVEIAQSVYVAHYGSTVNMTCMFPVAGGINMKDLKVYWHHKYSLQAMEKEIYLLDGGKENLNMQDAGYRGRATLLKDELYRGHAVLQIANVKLTDAGTYVCLIIYGGADHEQVTLQVKAPFKKINKLEKTIPDSEEEEIDLICQSEGFPKAEVIWQNEEQDLSDKANTSYRINVEQLYNITTVLRVSTIVNTTYRCIFWNKELQENTSEFFRFSGKDNWKLFQVPEQKGYYGTMLVGCVLIVLSMALLIWMKKNGLCLKPNTVCKDRKNIMDCFVCKRNLSNLIQRSTRNICLHSTDKGITVSLDIAEPNERLHITSKENRTYAPTEIINEVEADVHHEQEMVIKDT